MEMQKMDGWKDYMHRVRGFRDDLRKELEVGKVDNFGKNHDNELRACIYMLNTMLSYPEERIESFKRGEESFRKRINQKLGGVDGITATWRPPLS